jgi:hypothetical protein
MIRAKAFLVAAAAVVALAGSAVPTAAQTKLNAQYTATLGGISVGRGVWTVEINGDRYSSAVSGGTAGLISMFASGSGTGAASGTINNGIFAPGKFEATITSSRRVDDVRFSVVGGNARDVVVDPVAQPNPDRVPLSETSLRGISDPLTAALVRIPGTGDMITDQACVRGASVFTGRVRFDVRTTFKRVEQVRAQKGYQGPAVVCAAFFKPVAGHVPDRGIIKHLQDQRDMEIYLAPIAGTRVMAPYRIVVPTSLGLGALSATQFLVEPGGAPARTQ